MNKYLFLLIFIPTILYGQNNNLKRVENIVLNLTKLQWIYDYASEKHDYWIEKESEEYALNNYLLSYESIKEYLASTDSIQFSVTKIYNDSIYSIFLAYNQGDSPHKNYYVAYKKTGKFYFLKNYAFNEFEIFLNDKYGFIEKNEINEIINLYIKIIASGYFKKVIVDEQNLKLFNKDVELKPVSIKVYNDHYDVECYVIEPYTDGIYLYKFKILTIGNISSSVTVIKEPKFTPD